MNDTLKIGDKTFSSRLFVGTGKFPSPQIMLDAIVASGSQMITVAMKRVNMMNEASDDMLTHINRDSVQLLPNTSGVRNAREAITAAMMSREIFGTGFIKLEIHPDPKYLMPDPIETLKATESLAKEGF
ncbi:MAG: thiazole synthase, partial [Muribaculaceae bacterium]|nr:thiazole synthase [Muribaculaceae bacterium]